MSTDRVIEVDPLKHDLSTFGGRLAYARKRRGLGALELERAAKLSQGMVGRYERGERAEDGGEVTYATLEGLCEALKVPMSWLARGAGGDPFRRPGKSSGPATPAQAVG